MNATMKKLLNCMMVVLMGLNFSGCSKSNLSDREVRLEQIRAQAERKRKELKEVEGNYEGVLLVGENERPAFLNLEIRDVPTQVSGEVDPVMVPVLSGYIHLDTPPEHTPFGIENSEYDIKLRKLTLVLKNPVHGDLYISFAHEENKLDGTWLAPILGGEGTVQLEFTEDEQGNEL